MSIDNYDGFTLEDSAKHDDIYASIATEEEKRRINSSGSSVLGGEWGGGSRIQTTGIGAGISSWPVNSNTLPITSVQPNPLFNMIVDYTDDDKEILFSDDFKITAKELKICMKMMLKMAKEEYPEDFI